MVVTLVSYMVNPSMSHWVATKQVLQYLSGTWSYEITYYASEVRLGENQFLGYSNMSYVNNDDATLISGYVFSMSGGVVTWGSRKQTSMSLFSTESKYVVLADEAQEITWLQNFLEELGYEQCMPTELYRDNNGVLTIAQNPQYHKHMKHFDT